MDNLTEFDLDRLAAALVRGGITLEAAIASFEKKLIDAALIQSGGVVTDASRKLGVHRNTLTNKLRLQQPDKRMDRAERIAERNRNRPRRFNGAARR